MRIKIMRINSFSTINDVLSRYTGEFIGYNLSFKPVKMTLHKHINLSLESVVLISVSCKIFSPLYSTKCPGFISIQPQ